MIEKAIISISFPSIYFHLLDSSERFSIFYFRSQEYLPCPKSTILQKDSQMSEPWSMSIASGSNRAQPSIKSICLVAVVVVISVSRVEMCLAFAHVSFSMLSNVCLPIPTNKSPISFSPRQNPIHDVEKSHQSKLTYPLLSSPNSNILDGLGGGFGGGEGGSPLDIFLGRSVETERALLARRPECRTLEAANPAVLAPAPSPEPKPRSFTATAILSKIQIG